MSQSNSTYQQRPWLSPEEMQLVINVCLRCLEERAKEMSMASKIRVQTVATKAAA